MTFEFKDGSHIPPEVAKRQAEFYEALLPVAVSTTDGTWVNPNAGEIVAATFSDTDLPTPTKEDIITTRRNLDPQPDDLADEWRYNDSLIASRARRRLTHQAGWDDYLMRAAVLVVLVGVIFLFLVLSGIAVL